MFASKIFKKISKKKKKSIFVRISSIVQESLAKMNKKMKKIYLM